ncbi:hypothetical protein SAMN04489727_1722 [Amycolatopsis tolypomycina]|uniref:Uncharacterized protein n=1 Tax=Amycolatopsis tolypomycina TaxID=208445 RepID=A0A1H4JD54_9PSEU|nr:hypothetical protein [Amycolatopsis tolypomycina]SEB43538.1 hypothetical protein SAMN04489727_1722 [Amycolatopsis tolypomycina]
MQYKELSGDLVFTFEIPPTAAGTALEQPCLIVPFAATITSVRWVPGAAVTANATNFATLAFRNRGAAGAGAVQPATARSYAATNSVANVPETMALSSTASDLQPAAGDVLTATIAHSGTGLAIPAGLLQVALRVRG